MLLYLYSFLLYYVIIDYTLFEKSITWIKGDKQLLGASLYVAVSEKSAYLWYFYEWMENFVNGLLRVFPLHCGFLWEAGSLRKLYEQSKNMLMDKPGDTQMIVAV